MKERMFNIGVGQLLRNSTLYEHIFLVNIKNLYKSAGKCDDKHKRKSILYEAMVYTPEGLTDNSTIDVVALCRLKKPSAINLMSQILALLGVKQKTMSS